MGAAQLLGDLREGEPLGDLAAVGQPVAQLGAGERQHPGALRHLVQRPVGVQVLDVDHHLERHHLDAQLLLVLAQQLLGLVGTVERLAGGVVAGPGVVAADDEVGAAVVLADDGVQQRLARPAHAHRQRQQRQHRGVVGIALQHPLVAAHAGVVVDVARLGHAHDRVDQQVGLELAGRPQGELEVGPVHRVAGLEGHHLPPAEPLEARPHLARRVTQADEVVVRRQLQALEAAADGDVVGALVEMRDPGMGAVEGAVDRLGLGLAVDRPDVLDGQRRQHDALGVAQRQPVAGGQSFGRLLGDVEGDRDGPQLAAGEPHLVAGRLEVGAAHEARERREPAVQDQLEVADLPRRQVPGRPVARGLADLGPPLRADDQIGQGAAVGANR